MKENLEQSGIHQMETNNAERLQFRLQHIIPKNLAKIDHTIKETNRPLTNGPSEIEIQMTWGIVAGKFKL